MDQIWWTFIKMIVFLPLVLVLVVIMLRFGLRGYQGSFTSGTGMRVVDRLSLHAKGNLYVVHVHGIYYLLGSDNGHLTLIDKLEEYPIQENKPAARGKFEALLTAKTLELTRKLTGKVRGERYTGKK